ncbi:hypothetical protein C8F04DRAFT_1198050 [Mycena alexandri]|uniref:Uncharacterized protein n=1 Tax=Mycena alexandri TaxID=1745969 RepID=A0AAD6WNF7_9AGAR|nr:hypothetical protein C8F04DRAFT_1198050 [Mycena alexandri]
MPRTGTKSQQGAITRSKVQRRGRDSLTPPPSLFIDYEAEESYVTYLDDAVIVDNESEPEIIDSFVDNVKDARVGFVRPSISNSRNRPESIVKPSVGSDPIELDSSQEMFKKPAGVKATALPPALSTRSKRPIIVSSPEISSKKMKLDRVVSSPPEHTESTEAAAQDRMAKFMAGWMEDFMRNWTPQTPTRNNTRRARVDHDALALSNGLALSVTAAK